MVRSQAPPPWRRPSHEEPASRSCSPGSCSARRPAAAGRCPGRRSGGGAARTPAGAARAWAG
eukprot:2248848-Lingulodinium_polyedra.AAC.2